jgi:hypothetical protein
MRFPTLRVKQIKMVSYFRRFVSKERQGIPKEIIDKIQNYIVEIEWKENSCTSKYEKSLCKPFHDEASPHFSLKKVTPVL